MLVVLCRASRALSERDSPRNAGRLNSDLGPFIVLALWGTPKVQPHGVSVSTMLRDGQDVPDDARVSTLVGSSADIPAIAIDRYLTVLAANKLATAIHPAFAAGSSLPRAVFLGTADRLGDAGWGLACEHVSASLKVSLDRFGEDERFIGLIGELASLSVEFSSAWAQKASFPRGGIFPFVVSGTGTVALSYSVRPMTDGSGVAIVTWHPADARSAKMLNIIGRPEL